MAIPSKGALTKAFNRMFKPMTVSPSTSMPIDLNPVRKIKLTRFKRSLFDLTRSIHGDDMTIKDNKGSYFTMVPADAVIEALGWWNPVHGGRVRPFAQHLLEGLPTPVPGRSFRWKIAGLMYFTPHVIGRSKSKARTSSVGLSLLKHWKDRHPAFGKFFDCYYSKKVEREIILDCVDLAIGNLPTRFRAKIEANKIASAKEITTQTLAKQARQYQPIPNIYGTGVVDQRNLGQMMQQAGISGQQAGIALAQQFKLDQMQQHQIQAMKDSKLAAYHNQLGLASSLLGATKDALSSQKLYNK